MSRGTKQNTNEAILVAARKLFSERGYNNVGMRDIAAELNISVGNLTYHYKKKEELIEAVVEEMVNDYKKPVSGSTLEELDGLYLFAEQVVETNLFYFTHYTQISQNSEKIRNIQRRVFTDSVAVWAETFKNLCSGGLIEPEGFEGQFALFSNTIHFMKVYWLDRIETEKQMGVETPSFGSCAWSMTCPLLTEKGKEIYLSNIRNKTDRG